MLNHRGSILKSSEGSSARKRLVVNVNCQSHRTLQYQDRANLHNQPMCRPELIRAHALLTAAKLDRVHARSGHCLTGTPTLLGCTSTGIGTAQLASTHELPFPRRGIDE